jgi:sec-independent protein translocase protein TatA
MSMLAFTTPGPSEWMLILIIVLVLFGAKKLPELARSLGQSMNEFRKAREEFDKELQQAGQDVKAQAQSAQPQNTQSYQPQPAAQTVQTAQPVQTQQPSAPVNPPTQPTQPS